MATPLRYNMILPNGQPLRWNMPGARWGGTVEEVMAALEQQNSTMSQNLISAAFAANATSNIATAVGTIRTNTPFLLSLTPDQRKHLASVTEASQGGVLAAINFVAQHPEALSATFDMTEYNKDAALLAPMLQNAALIAQLNDDYQNTLKALLSDLYAESLDVYAFAKVNNRSGAYSEFINTFKTRFSSGPRKKTAPAAAKP